MFFDETKNTLSFFLSFFFSWSIFQGGVGGKKTAWGNIITDKIYPNEC